MSIAAPPAARSLRGARAVPRRSVSFVLLWLAVGFAFAISGGVLWMFGLNYDGLAGSAATKVHPSTYLLFLNFGLTILRSRDPVRQLIGLAEARPAALFLFLAATISLLDLALRHGAGLAGIVDTFMAAALVSAMVTQMDERQMAKIATLVHVVMAANALLALYEMASGVRLFVFRFDGVVLPLDSRSTALQGHPLANAAVTCFYVLALIATRGASLPPLCRLPMLALQYAALVSFGGRAALVTALVLGSAVGVARAATAIRYRRIPLLGVAAALICAFLLPLVVGGLYAGGFFETIVSRFAADGGSAQARIQMFDMFDGLPWRDLVVGPDPGLIDSTRRTLGLEWGIENPFVKTLLYQGIVITVMMTVAVVAYLYEVAKAAGPGTLVPMLGFAVVVVTSESIGGKTTMMTKFAVMILCLYGPLRTKRSAIKGSR